MLDFHAAVEDADAHHGQLVVRRVGVVVDAAEKSDTCVRSNGAFDEVGAARVVGREGRDIVDKAVNNNEFTRLGFLDKVVP